MTEDVNKPGIRLAELNFLRELEHYAKNNDDLGVGLAKWALAVLRRLHPWLIEPSPPSPQDKDPKAE